jgi:hypothetical protein
MAQVRVDVRLEKSRSMVGGPGGHAVPRITNRPNLGRIGIP